MAHPLPQTALDWAEEAFFSVLLIGGLYLAYESLRYSPDARIFPLMIVTILNVLLVIQLLKLIVGRFRSEESDPSGEGEQTGNETAERESGDDTESDTFDMAPLSLEDPPLERELRAAGWIGGFGVAIYLLGFFLAIPLFLALFLKVETEMALPRILVFTVGLVVVVYLLFVELLNSRVYSGVLLGSLVVCTGPGSVNAIAEGERTTTGGANGS